MTDEFIYVLAQSLTATMDMEDAKRLARSIMSERTPLTDNGEILPESDGAAAPSLSGSIKHEVADGPDKDR